jgi:hypothetical protein
MTDQLVNEDEINQILAIVNLLTMIRSCFFLHNWIIWNQGWGKFICVKYATIHATHDKSIVNENHTWYFQL